MTLARRLNFLAARQAAAELRRHEGRKRGTIGPARNLCGTRLAVLTNDGMQNAAFGSYR